MALDARHCPDCGALGILRLSQVNGSNDSIRSPRMLCPRCRKEFRAEGMTWVGPSGPSTPVAPGGLTDEQITEMAEMMVERLFAAIEVDQHQ